MALFRDDSGRTEEPTPHRLEEAAEKGQVPMSRELVTAGTLAAAVLALLAAGPFVWRRLAGVLARGLDVAADRDLVGTATVRGATAEILGVAAPLGAPLVALAAPALIAVLLLGYGQVGLRFRRESLRIDPGRLAPTRNLDRLMNLGAAVRALSSLLLLVAVGAVVWLVVRAHAAELATLAEREPGPAFGIVFDVALQCLGWIAALAFVVATLDFTWQRLDHRRQLRMTRQEVEDERKRTEGDPLVRSRVRQAALDLARRRMMDAVPKADVVITNPTHFAVALAYDRTRNAAPEVVAKGADLTAQRIRELAREHDVPIMEDPPLARALFRAVKVGQEIPERFYKAVATVLGHVLRLRRGATAPAGTGGER
ncbi:MAG: flagellar biosynthesis protein FlhB [Planctomycetes bacterium]|nr:flagellar biosynthesis protein FlhB [Planctomycetota bacterium]